MNTELAIASRKLEHLKKRKKKKKTQSVFLLYRSNCQIVSKQVRVFKSLLVPKLMFPRRIFLPQNLRTKKTNDEHDRWKANPYR